MPFIQLEDNTGHEHTFIVSSLDREWEQIPAVYVLTRTEQVAERRSLHHVVYVGEINDLRMLNDNGRDSVRSRLDEYEPDSVCYREVRDAAERRRIAESLAESLEPKYTELR